MTQKQKMSDPAQEQNVPVAYRWRALGMTNWIYDPSPEWREEHKDNDEVEIQPLYRALAAPLQDETATNRDQELCPGGIDPGFEECPKCGASMDDACAGMSAPVERPNTPADEMIGEIEKRFPNWKSYRDLVDCIDVTLHNLRGGR